MPFPIHDQYWLDTADFVQTYIRDDEMILAPVEFEEKFQGKILPYSSTFAGKLIPQWAIIHKGMLNEINYDILRHISKKLIPVFANEVFVVFASRRDLPEVSSASPHVKSFLEKLKRKTFKSTTNIIKRWIISVGLGSKETIKKIPLLRSVAKRIYHWMRLSETIPLPETNPIVPDDHIDYSNLSTAEIKNLMDARYKKGEAYVMTCLWDKVRAEELNKRVIDMISPTENKKILELGAGVDGTAAYISGCKEFIGIDISEVAVSQARKHFGNKPNFSFLAMDAMDLKFDDNYFDIVIAKEVIEHLPKPQMAIKEAFRVLKAGGLFVVTSPNRDSLHLRVNRMLGYPDFKCSFDHIREFTFSEAREMLIENGFIIKDTGGVFLQPYWGIKGIDEHVRHLTDNDPQMVEMLRDLGERVGAEYAFCFVILCVKPETKI
jgi:ubiquinone/menaquinone biosynthesis C-methylase UbiE